MARFKQAARTALMMICGAGLWACAPLEPVYEASEETRRALSTGEVRGYLNESGAQSWLGLSYAASTAGENRWRAPQPTLAWDGVLDALDHADPCPQITNTLSAEATGRSVGELFGSEDCLKLDVYAPAGAGPDSANRPVMMWIHGGSNTWGYGSHYDGAQLAQDQNVVVVVIQYRLGPLGFFAHPATDDGMGSNFALLDHVAALNWIQREIGQFGGDAGNVTVFGESAGGQNVAALMASPLARGLFHRAIIQSGLFDSFDLEQARNHAQARAEDMLNGSPVTASALRGLALETVYAAYDLGGERGDMPRVIADGVSLPETGLASAFESAETFNAVPVITGTNRDEMKLFNAVDPRLTSRWLGVLIRIKDPVFYDRLAHYQSRLWRIGAVDEAAAKMQAGGHDAVWAYRFDWDESGTLLTMDLGRILGAAHGVEIPFVFNHFDFFGRLDGAMFNARNAPGRGEVARSMGAYWAEFARTGDPSSAGGPDWPAWQEDGVLMRFDTPGAELLTGVDTTDLLLADLEEDDVLDPEQKCLIGGALIDWRASLTEPVQTRLGCT